VTDLWLFGSRNLFIWVSKVHGHANESPQLDWSALLIYLGIYKFVTYYLLQAVSVNIITEFRMMLGNGWVFLCCNQYLQACTWWMESCGCRQDGLWLSDHTSNSCTLYTRGTNLGGDPGPATLQLVLLFQPPTGIMLGGGEGWGERRTCHGWRHLNKPYYKAFVLNYFHNF